MKEYTLNVAKDKAFFSFPRQDWISRAPLRHGDTIVVCGLCNAVMRKESWVANDRKCGRCNSTELLNITPQYLQSLNVPTQKVQRRHTSSSVSHKQSSPEPQFGTFYQRHPRPVPILADETPSVPRRDTGRTYAADRYPVKRAKRKRAGRLLLAVVIALIIVAIVFAVRMAAFAGEENHAAQAPVHIASTGVAFSNAPSGMPP